MDPTQQSHRSGLPPSQGRASDGAIGVNYGATLLDQLFNDQQAAAQRAEMSLHQQGLLQSLLPSQSSKNILAAALQQEIAASLGNVNSPLLPSLPGGHQSGIGGGLLSAQKNYLRQLAPSTPSVSSESLIQSLRASTDPSPAQSVANADSDKSRGVALTLPCQARGMAADHNSSVSIHPWRPIAYPWSPNFLFLSHVLTRPRTLRSQAQLPTGSISCVPTLLAVLQV